MAQTYTINCYVSTHGGQSDLAIMETNFESLRSTFSGAGAPANAVAGMMWFDTAQNLLKVRNDANDAWLGVLTGTTSLKVLIYRNTAEDGWAIDSGVTDRVVAVKGGATYTTGGATAGSWSHTHAAGHRHKWYENNAVGVTDQSHDSDGNAQGISGTPKTAGFYAMRATNGGISNALSADQYTDNGSEIPANTTFRPAAVVVTLQYPDI